MSAAARSASTVRANLRRLGRSVERFGDQVARKYGFRRLEDFWGSRRTSETHARHELVTLVTDTLALTLRDAAKLFGVDHSCVRTSRHAYYARMGPIA